MRIQFADYCIEAPSDASPAAIAQHCKQELARLTVEDPSAASELAAAIDEIVLEFSQCLGVPDEEPPGPGTGAPPMGDEPEPRKSKRTKKGELTHV